MTEIEYLIERQSNMSPTIERIEDEVCKAFEITIEELHSNTRKRPIPIARYFVWYFAKRNSIFQNIVKMGLHFNKDHATVLHGLHLVADLIAFDKHYKEIHNKLLIEIG